MVLFCFLHFHSGHIFSLVEYFVVNAEVSSYTHFTHPAPLSCCSPLLYIYDSCQWFPNVPNISPTPGDHCHISFLIDTDSPIVWGKSNEMMMMMILTAGCLPALTLPLPLLFSPHNINTHMQQTIYVLLSKVKMFLLLFFLVKGDNPVLLSPLKGVYVLMKSVHALKFKPNGSLAWQQGDKRINYQTLAPFTSKVIIMG